MRDRDVMNLLDQLELYVLRIGGRDASQRDFWIFVYRSMKSGLLLTQRMEEHVRSKLAGLGVNMKEAGRQAGG